MLKRIIKRPILSLLAWLLLVSFYLSVCLNIAFYKQVVQALPLDSLRNILVFLSMPVVAFSVINIVLTLASFLWLNRLLACLFILMAASAQYFIMTYGIIIDRSMIANMVDTTPAETFALMTPRMVLTLGLSGIVAAIVWWRLFSTKITPRCFATIRNWSKPLARQTALSPVGPGTPISASRTCRWSASAKMHIVIRRCNKRSAKI